MRPELYKYLSGIINSEGAKQLACNGVEDHIHLLVSIEAKHSVSDLVKKIAEKCGFSSSHHLLRVFKKFENVTPVEYRLEHT